MASKKQKLAWLMVAAAMAVVFLMHLSSKAWVPAETERLLKEHELRCGPAPSQSPWDVIPFHALTVHQAYWACLEGSEAPFYLMFLPPAATVFLVLCGFLLVRALWTSITCACLFVCVYRGKK